MKFAMILGLALLPLGTSAFADNFAGCDKPEIRILGEVMRNAKDLTLKAATSVGNTPTYERWFGEYSDAHAEVVRANLKSVVTAIRSGAVITQCDDVGMDGCEGGTYAWVYATEAYLLHLCPSFFDLPPLAGLRPGTRASDDGTREGTIVHELTHFLRVARTEDHCYSRSECRIMATDDPLRAIENADSYQYFTEDVTYYARQLPAGKTPVGSGVDQ